MSYPYIIIPSFKVQKNLQKTHSSPIHTLQKSKMSILHRYSFQDFREEITKRKIRRDERRKTCSSLFFSLFEIKDVAQIALGRIRRRLRTKREGKRERKLVVGEWKVRAKKRGRRRLAEFAGQNRRVKPFTRYVTKESEFASPATQPATFHAALSHSSWDGILSSSWWLVHRQNRAEPWKVYIFPCRKSSSLVSRVLFNDRRWVTLVSVAQSPAPAKSLSLRVLATRKRSKWNPLNRLIFISRLPICIQIWHVRESGYWRFALRYRHVC